MRRLSASETAQHLQTEHFGRSGAGAPVRTESGRIEARRKAALSKSYTDPAELKRKEMYAQELKRQQNETAHRRAMERSFTQEGSDYNPWGQGTGKPALDPEGKPTGKRVVKPPREDGPQNLSLVGKLGTVRVVVGVLRSNEGLSLVVVPQGKLHDDVV